MSFARHFNEPKTPGTEKARSNQVKNNAGGYVFKVDDWIYLDRFLIIGTEGGSFYSSERKLTVEACQNVLNLIRQDGIRVVNRCIEISHNNRAPKNDYAVFVLALCASYGNPNVVTYALNNLSKVVRIGTHLFQFVQTANANRGWGSGLQRGIDNWYHAKYLDGSLTQDVLKYRARDGVSHRDVLRLSHTIPKDDIESAIFKLAVKKEGFASFSKEDLANISRRIGGDQGRFVDAIGEIWLGKPSLKRTCSLIREHSIPREVIPTELLTESVVWDALLQNMPPHALIRNLGNLAKVGLITPLSEPENLVVAKLNNHALLNRKRVHPISVLLAMKVYQSGSGVKGSGSWKPSKRVVSALEDAFYATFAAIEPTNKRYFIALDVSGSMDGNSVLNTCLDAREASCAMSMVTVRSEPNHYVMGFSHNLVDVGIGKNDSLSDVIGKARRIPMGGTNCSLPMLHALQNKIPVDVFVVYTDSETYLGDMHPFEALKKYRAEMRINSKLIVVAFTATKFSIADPSDPRMLDVCGLDGSLPQIVSEFGIMN